MNNRQEARLNMYNVIISFCNDNLNIIATVPALGIVFTTFKDKVASIVSAVQQKALVIRGVAESKQFLRKLLVSKIARVSAVLLAYASAANNFELKQQATFSISDLLKLKDEELVALCQNIVAAINTNLTALSGYNITTDSIKDLADTIAQFSSAVPRPRTAVSQRSYYVDSLIQLFEGADNILNNQMDNIVTNLEITNPEFHGQYMNNRSLMDPRSTSSQLKGTVTSKNTKAVLPGVLITVVEESITGTTNAQGKYLVKPLPPGIYTIKATKDGYVPVTLTGVTIKLGNITTVNVEMVVSTQE